MLAAEATTSLNVGKDPTPFAEHSTRETPSDVEIWIVLDPLLIFRLI